TSLTTTPANTSAPTPTGTTTNSAPDQRPSLERIRTLRRSQGERIFRIADLTGEHQRWPAFAPQAHALGVGSMMGFLLFTDDEEFGALNLHSRKPGAFTEASELAGWMLASH